MCVCVCVRVLTILAQALLRSGLKGLTNRTNANNEKRRFLEISPVSTGRGILQIMGVYVKAL